MRGAGGFDKEEYLVLVLAESFFKSDVKNDLHITLTFEGEKGYIEYNGRGGCHLRVFERAFGAGRCGSVCAETKRRVSARCHNGNAAAG